MLKNVKKKIILQRLFAHNLIIFNNDFFKAPFLRKSLMESLFVKSYLHSKI